MDYSAPYITNTWSQLLGAVGSETIQTPPVVEKFSSSCGRKVTPLTKQGSVKHPIATFSLQPIVEKSLFKRPH
jgi:hypothetical protein